LVTGTVFKESQALHLSHRVLWKPDFLCPLLCPEGRQRRLCRLFGARSPKSCGLWAAGRGRVVCSTRSLAEEEEKIMLVSFNEQKQ